MAKYLYTPEQVFTMLAKAGDKEATLKLFEKLSKEMFEDSVKRNIQMSPDVESVRLMMSDMYSDLLKEGRLEGRFPKYHCKTLAGWLHEYTEETRKKAADDPTRITTRTMVKLVTSAKTKEEAIFNFEHVVMGMWEKEEGLKEKVDLETFLLKSAVSVQEILEHYAASKFTPEEDCKRAFYYFYGYDPQQRKDVRRVN